jgi:hypothetical protein
MTARSDNGTSETRDATTVVSVGKDGRIEILDAAVLDLIAGGLVKASPALRDNGNCNCLREV